MPDFVWYIIVAVAALAFGGLATYLFLKKSGEAKIASAEAEAKKILLVANGAGKAKAIADTLEGPITPQVPASILQLHHDVTIIIDEAAAAGLKEYHE